ncbi:YjcZ family sporulation protein [Peribacillus simplex]
MYPFHLFYFHDSHSFHTVTFAFIVVLFILLIIVGASCFGGGFC